MADKMSPDRIQPEKTGYILILLLFNLQLYSYSFDAGAN
jgi:hypothetical protein